MNDLVFVKYNLVLKNRKGVKDVISLKDVDECNEWLTGRMEEDNSDDDDELVFEDDNLTWDVVARASGVEEDAYRTRGKGKSSTTIPSAKPTKTYTRGENSSRSKYDCPSQVVGDEVIGREDDDDEYQVDEEEEYKDDDSDLDDDMGDDIDVDEDLDLGDDV
ncbi:hAT dimerization domain-containing protein / transposase-related [Euphorbia peplus]|nr:hAT dimerization domain-containing protein / transposase-related [Euphorbia peplus]